MTTVAQLPAELRVALPASQALASLEAGAAYACVLAEDAEERAAALAAVLAGLDVDRTRIIGVSNPLNAPLTIERLLFQAVGPQADLHLDDLSVAVGLLARAAGSADHLILAIEQADTLDDRALLSLLAILPEFSSITPTLQILFVGSPAFEARLQYAGDAPGSFADAAPAPVAVPRESRGPLKYAIAAALLTIVGGLGAARIAYPDLLWPRAAPGPGQRTAGVDVPEAAAPAPAPAAVTPAIAAPMPGGEASAPASVPQPQTASAAARVPVEAASPGTGVGAEAPLVSAPQPGPEVANGGGAPAPAVVAAPPAAPEPAGSGSRAPAVAEVAAPRMVAPPVAVAPPGAGSAPSQQTGKPAQQAASRHPAPARSSRAQRDEAEVRRLRRNFDRFLARSGDAPIGLTPAEREMLFQEYLARHRGEGAQEERRP